MLISFTCSHAEDYNSRSSEPKAFHLYVGNLDTAYDSSSVRSYLTENGIKVLECELIQSTRGWADDFVRRATSAHVVIDSADKDKALSASAWEAGIIVRPWRFPRRLRTSDDYRRWN